MCHEGIPFVFVGVFCKWFGKLQNLQKRPYFVHKAPSFVRFGRVDWLVALTPIFLERRIPGTVGFTTQKKNSLN